MPNYLVYTISIILVVTIFLALFEVFRWRVLRKNRNPWRSTGQSEWPILLSANVREYFEIFPETPPISYIRYTEYFAMCVSVNDDLAARKPAEQYALLGFGSGFLTVVDRRLTEGKLNHRIAFLLRDAAMREKQFLGWLAYLQKSGTDNAGPSTSNLRNVIYKVASEVCATGPIKMRFGEKLHNKKCESLEFSGTTLDTLEELRDEYQKNYLEGERTACSATIVESA